MKIWIPDSSNTIFIPGNEDETLSYAARQIENVCKEAIEKRGKAFIALSGGSTPKAIFERLSPLAKEVYLFWSDERMDGSNQKMALESPAFKNCQVMGIELKLPPHQAASHYEAVIQKQLNGETFDLVMLGMGDDGHTASLFPETEALKEPTRWVVANWVEKLKSHRITFTYPLLHLCKNKSIYVLGEHKAEMMRKVFLDEPSNYPVKQVGTKEHQATWILDRAAAGKLC